MYGLSDSKLLLTASSEEYGTDRSKLPSHAPNFFYRPSTGTANLRSHLRKRHPKEYDQAIKTHGWDYDLSSEVGKNSRNICNQETPSYTNEGFHRATAVWIVADDQVSLKDSHSYIYL